jgi:ABC-type transporter Mla maintaining outer membrane lipid asymmetry ATPase subunit MlaF
MAFSPEASGSQIMRSVSEPVMTHARADCVVEARNLRRGFGDRRVLDGLDLQISRGEFVALIGKSGCGKTTLLRALAGLDPVYEGDLRAPAARAVVFQEHRLLPWRRVWTNGGIGLPRAPARQRAAAALDEVGLGDHLDAWPVTLSGGEAQRVALARALVRSCKEDILPGVAMSSRAADVSPASCPAGCAAVRCCPRPAVGISRSAPF